MALDNAIATDTDAASSNAASDGAAAGSTGTAATSTDPASSGNPDIGALLGQANAGVISISELMQQVGGRYTVLVDPLGTISLGPPQESTAGAFSTAADSSDDASTNVIINGAAAGSTGTAATSTDPASSGNPDIDALLGQANAGVISISELMQQVGGRYTVLVDPLGTIRLGPPQESTAGAFSTAADSSDDASTNVIINGAAAGSTGTAATSTDPASSGNPDIGALLGQANAGVISISELMQQVGGRYTVLVDPLGTISFGPPQESTAGAFSTAADSSDDASTNVIINGAAAGSTGTAATSTDPASSGNPDIGALLGQANAGVISISELMQQVGGRYTVLVDPLGTIRLGPPQESTAGAFSTAADSSDDASTNVIINGAAAGSTGTAATTTDPAGSPDVGYWVSQVLAGTLDFSQLGAHLGSGYTVVRRPDGQINVIYDGTSGSAGSLPAASGSADPAGNGGTSIAIDTGSANTGTDSTTVSTPIAAATATDPAGSPDVGYWVGQVLAGTLDFSQLGAHLGSGYTVVRRPDGQINVIYDGTSGSAGSSTTVEALGSTSLVQVGSNYFLNPVGASSGPELSLSGVPLAAGGSYTPIAAEQTASGYDVALKMAADTYTVWATDGMGNYGSTIINPMSGTSAAFEALESTFQQDLNGDGIIGLPPSPPPTVIEALGSTSLVQVGSNYFLNPVGASSGPELSLSGMPVAAGGSYTPIAAEQTASGYDVALKMAADTYTVWATDGMGNYGSTIINPMSGTSAAFEALEPTFQQDLNGDGIIGVPPSPPPTVIEALGSTSLVQVGSNYFLNPVGASSGPELSLSGVPLAAGGSYTPIAAEQTASGYDVALRMAADTYTVWATDGMGNYGSTIINPMSGTSAAFEALEPTFQQDLNGDGIIGVPPSPPPTVIEALGSTSLVQVGSNYFLNPVGASSGPELSLSGVPLVAGGSYTPIAAEQTASGYDVALKMAADTYTVWATDGMGNYGSTIINPMSGTSAAFEALEPVFEQDLNGDGVIGVLTHFSPATAQSNLTVDAGATVELSSAYNGTVTFAASPGTLQLDESSSFTGTVAGLRGQDAIDFAAIGFGDNSTVGYAANGDKSGGTLSVGDGTHMANIALLGSYMASSFVAAGDGHGGTLISAAAQSMNETPLVTQPHA